MNLNTPDILIEKYEDEAVACDESGYPTTALEAQLTANVLTRWRDCLILIAECQGGVASHQAQEALKAYGYCNHSRAIYHDTQITARITGWTCPDCGRIDGERLVAYK